VTDPTFRCGPRPGSKRCGEGRGRGIANGQPNNRESARVLLRLPGIGADKLERSDLQHRSRPLDRHRSFAFFDSGLACIRHHGRFERLHFRRGGNGKRRHDDDLLGDHQFRRGLPHILQGHDSGGRPDLDQQRRDARDEGHRTGDPGDVQRLFEQQNGMAQLRRGDLAGARAGGARRHPCRGFTSWGCCPAQETLRGTAVVRAPSGGSAPIDRGAFPRDSIPAGLSEAACARAFQSRA